MLQENGVGEATAMHEVYVVGTVWRLSIKNAAINMETWFHWY